MPSPLKALAKAGIINVSSGAVSTARSEFLRAIAICSKASKEALLDPADPRQGKILKKRFEAALSLFDRARRALKESEKTAVAPEQTKPKF